MQLLYRALRPLVFALDPEQAHGLTLGLLRAAHRISWRKRGPRIEWKLTSRPPPPGAAASLRSAPVSYGRKELAAHFLTTRKTPTARNAIPTTRATVRGCFDSPSSPKRSITTDPVS